MPRWSFGIFLQNQPLEVVKLFLIRPFDLSLQARTKIIIGVGITREKCPTVSQSEHMLL